MFCPYYTAPNKRDKCLNYVLEGDSTYVNKYSLRLITQILTKAPVFLSR